MKHPIKWLSRALVLILIIVCADMDLNGAKLSASNQDLRQVINIITAAIVMIVAIRVLIPKKSAKRGE
jgi:hypothetical protein